jgi:hypothetical protein
MHLDAASWGLLTWVNCMAEGVDSPQIDAYLGIYVNSAKCVSEVKRIAGEEYKQFSEEFDKARSTKTPGRQLVDVMKGSSRDEKLWIAWSYYILQRLKSAGVNDLWTRKYVKASEFQAVVASLSLVHFGARFPMIFEGPPPDKFQNLYQIRMHSYLGRTWIRATSLNASGAHFERDDIETKTLDICNDPILNPALQFMDSREIIPVPGCQPLFKLAAIVRQRKLIY